MTWVQKLVAWLKTFSTVHHITFAGVWTIIGGIITCYKEMPQFHAWVLALYGKLPDNWQEAVGVLLPVAFWMWYHNGQKPLGAQAPAEQIKELETIPPTGSVVNVKTPLVPATDSAPAVPATTTTVVTK